MARSKTAQKQQKKVLGIPFKKGDPRINRKGRPPRNTAELDKLLDEIFVEQIADSQGKKMQKLRVALNRLLLSKGSSGPIYLIDRRFGKIPERMDLTSKGEKINTNENEIYERIMARIQGRMESGKPNKAA